MSHKARRRAKAPVAPIAPPSVPATFRIVAFYPTVIIQCDCPASPVLALIGTGAVGVCSGCGKSYAILDPMVVRVGPAGTP